MAASAESYRTEMRLDANNNELKSSETTWTIKKYPRFINVKFTSSDGASGQFDFVNVNGNWEWQDKDFTKLVLILNEDDKPEIHRIDRSGNIRTKTFLKRV